MPCSVLARHEARLPAPVAARLLDPVDRPQSAADSKVHASRLGADDRPTKGTSRRKTQACDEKTRGQPWPAYMLVRTILFVKRRLRVASERYRRVSLCTLGIRPQASLRACSRRRALLASVFSARERKSAACVRNRRLAITCGVQEAQRRRWQGRSRHCTHTPGTGSRVRLTPRAGSRSAGRGCGGCVVVSGLRPGATMCTQWARRRSAC